MTTMRWTDPVDETQPYPWASIRCPGCFEKELVGARGFGEDDFVCMTCGTITKIEAQP